MILMHLMRLESFFNESRSNLLLKETKRIRKEL